MGEGARERGVGVGDFSRLTADERVRKEQGTSHEPGCLRSADFSPQECRSAKRRPGGLKSALQHHRFIAREQRRKARVTRH